MNEIINSYHLGKRVFENLNLSNLSFKRENLTDSFFCNCQINSTDFSQANLSNSKFVQCQTGLSNFWLYCSIILLLLISFIQGILLFGISLITMYIKSQTGILFTLIFCVSLIGIFAITVFTPYFKRKILFSLFNLPFFFFLINGFLGLIAGYKMITTLAILSFFSSINGLFAGFLIIGLAINFSITLLIKNKLLPILIMVNIITSLIIANTFSVIIIPTLITNIYCISLALYLSNDAIKYKSKSWLYQLCLFLIAQKTTKFYQSNLSNAKFEKTELEYLDLRKANLTNINYENMNNFNNLIS